MAFRQLLFWLAFQSIAYTDEPLRVQSAEANERLDALFQRTSGWIGADGNYSVALSKERTLWFFSDTWLGEIENGKRKNAKMINNSVGVMAGDEVKYYWGGTKEKPAAFLISDDKLGWVWPVACAASGGKVYLFLWRMEKAKGPAAFAFRMAAVWLAVIENPSDEPPKWRIKHTKLPFTQSDDQQRIAFGSAMMIRGEDAYLYGTLERPKEKGFGRRMVMAQVKATSLGDFKQWRFRTADGFGEDFTKAEPLTKDVATEYSVTNVPALDRFVLVTHEAMLSPRILARTAPNPWGPWSEATALYTCPEAKWSKANFCYSGKAHPELSAKNELVITYAANAHSLREVLDDSRLYWPKFVTVKLVNPR